jgi:hypothetical protein
MHGMTAQFGRIVMTVISPIFLPFKARWLERSLCKLGAALSPEEKKRIEAKPTDSLEAYDLYLQAKALIADVRIIIAAKKPLREAVNLLERLFAWIQNSHSLTVFRPRLKTSFTCGTKSRRSDAPPRIRQ